MAASANPSGSNQEGASGQKIPSSSSTAANGVPVNSGNNGGNNSYGATAGPDNSQTIAALRHNSGIAVEWNSEEQSMLEDLLAKYASESPIVRYAKIAMQLKDKTVRDVALRCRWMTKKENGKRRKDDHNSARKNKDRKEKGTDSMAKSSSLLSLRPNGPSFVPPMIPAENDDDISFKDIGGVAGELLEQNAQMLDQISANFAAFQINDNINLFCKTRDNFSAILNEFYSVNDMPDIMKQMPPLPVKVNDELANAILPQQPHQMKS